MCELTNKFKTHGCVSIDTKKINKKRLKKVLTMGGVDDKLALLNTKVLSNSTITIKYIV